MKEESNLRGLPWKLYMALGLAILAATFVVGSQIKPASAHHDEYVDCNNPDITRAIREVTGVEPRLGEGTCNPYLYNNGSWSSYSELKTHVTNVMNSCNKPGEDNKLLVQAVISDTGQKPAGGVCNRSVYETWWRGTSSSAGPPPPIDWTKYRDHFPEQVVEGAVRGTLSMCHDHKVAQAVIQVTGQPTYPTTVRVGQEVFPSKGSKGYGNSGQCNPGLYNNGMFYGYDQLVGLVQQRVSSATQCGDAWISEVTRELTGGWNPLSGECAISRYGGGNWSSRDDLKTRIYASWQCRDPWIGQVYAVDYNRSANGLGTSGECNGNLYGSWTTYNGLRSNMGITQAALQNNNMQIQQNGSVRVTKNGTTTTFPANSILVQNPSNVVAAGAGNVVAAGAGNVIAAGAGNLVPLGNGSVIAAGAGNVVAAGAGNVVAAGAGNVIAAGGLN